MRCVRLQSCQSTLDCLTNCKQENLCRNNCRATAIAIIECTAELQVQHTSGQTIALPIALKQLERMCTQMA